MSQPRLSQWFSITLSSVCGDSDDVDLDEMESMFSHPISSPQNLVEVLSLLVDLAERVWDFNTNSSRIYFDEDIIIRHIPINHMNNIYLDNRGGPLKLGISDDQTSHTVDACKLLISENSAFIGANVDAMSGDEQHFDFALTNYAMSQDMYTFFRIFDRILSTFPTIYEQIGGAGQTQVPRSLGEFMQHPFMTANGHFLVRKMTDITQKVKCAVENVQLLSL
jgi:hypothetical protein